MNRPSNLRFDAFFVLLSVWFVGGLMVDTWAHSFNVADAQETFFTVWHAGFYSGYFALAGLMGAEMLIRRQSGRSWRETIPAGYELSVVGLGMFVIGGGLDPLWHLVAGREVKLDILMSPTHLFFSVAMMLVVSGPLRAAWQRFNVPETYKTLLPMLGSVILLHWMLTFQTLYNHPINVFPSTRWAGSAVALYSDIVGMSGYLAHTALLMALTLILIRRWRLPFGVFTLWIGLHYAMLAAQNYLYSAILPVIAGAVLGGIGIDILYARLKPTYADQRRLYLFSFLMPVILYTTYFAAVLIFDAVLWSVHLVIGAVVISGLVGLGLAVLVTLIATPPTPSISRE